MRCAYEPIREADRLARLAERRLERGVVLIGRTEMRDGPYLLFMDREGKVFPVPESLRREPYRASFSSFN